MSSPCNFRLYGCRGPGSHRENASTWRRHSRSASKVVLFCFVFNFIYFWLRWVLIAVRGLSPVAASGGYSSPPWPLVAEHGLQAHGLQ